MAGTGFRLMEESDLDIVNLINRDFAITGKGVSEYIKRSGAYVLLGEDGVVGYVLFRRDKNGIAVDRIGASEPWQYAKLLSGVLYFAEGSRGCEFVRVCFQTRNLILRHELKLSGFFFVADEDGVSVFAKNMRESTWREGCFYPFGELVIEEILFGEGKVLGA